MTQIGALAAGEGPLLAPYVEDAGLLRQLGVQDHFAAASVQDEVDLFAVDLDPDQRQRVRVHELF